MSTDKPAVLAEMFRVLVPGGRIGITDVVAEDHLSVADREAAGSYVGCLAGALSGAEYLDGLSAAGFADASVTFTTEAAFNPVVTAADWVLGRRTPRRYGLGQAAAVIACQVAGAIAGAALADAMFAEPILSPSHHHRGGAIGTLLAITLYPVRPSPVRVDEPAQLAG